MLKEVGKRARFDIEALLGSKVFLEVWVKVQKIGVTSCHSFETLVSVKTSIKI